MAEKTALILFVRIPEKGRVKTRLAKELDESFVLDLYKGFVCDLFDKVKDLPDIRVYVWPGGKNRILFDLVGDGFDVYPQAGKNIGEKMAAAMADVFSQGVGRALVIGTDIPELDCQIIQQADCRLSKDQVVIGPCRDGGYYLIAIRRSCFSKTIFQDIDWSTEKVLEQTLKKIDALGLSWSLLPELSDIDTRQDLDSLAQRMKAGAATGPQTIKMINAYDG